MLDLYSVEEKQNFPGQCALGSAELYFKLGRLFFFLRN